MTIAEGLGKRGGRLLSVLLSEPTSELANAVREAKVEPIRTANRDRLRRLLGPVSDLDTRADLGPALILMHLMIHGAAPDEQLIREQFLPAMTSPPGIKSVGCVPAQAWVSRWLVVQCRHVPLR